MHKKRTPWKGESAWRKEHKKKITISGDIAVIDNLNKRYDALPEGKPTKKRIYIQGVGMRGTEMKVQRTQEFNKRIIMKKLYRIKTLGLERDIYCLAQDPTEAYQVVKKELDKEEYGFSSDREFASINIIAEMRTQFPGNVDRII